MVYRDALRHACKGCGKIREPAERFSVRGKCQACGNGAMLEQTNQMRQHSGEYFQEWRRKVARSVGAVVVDDLQRDE